MCHGFRPEDPSTRPPEVKKIMEWAQSGGDEYVYVLQAPGGYGKSTLANTLSAAAESEQWLVAFYTFRLKQGNSLYWKAFFPSLIYQLANSVFGRKVLDRFIRPSGSNAEARHITGSKFEDLKDCLLELVHEVKG